MKIDNLPVVILSTLLIHWFSCSPPTSSPPYKFISHHVKMQLDPVQQMLIAVDTVYLEYEKNIDHFCFLLHDSLRVDRVGIGNQSFAIKPVTLREAKRLFAALPAEEWPRFEEAQIVRIDLPKSLYAEKVEIFYSGYINLRGAAGQIWHPTVPHSHSTCKIAAVVPAAYRFVMPGVPFEEEIDQEWRLYRWSKDESQMDFPLVESMLQQ